MEVQHQENPNMPVWQWDRRASRIEVVPDDAQDQPVRASVNRNEGGDGGENGDEYDFSDIELHDSPEICRMLRMNVLGVLQDARRFSRHCLEAALEKVWNIKQGRFFIKLQYENTLLITVEDRDERDFVLEGSPWDVEGGLLMLTPCKLDITGLQSFKMEKSPVWVQLRGLNGFLCPQMAVKVGAVAGEVHLIDWQENNPYMRLRTTIRPDEPLIAGVYLLDQDGNKEHWFEFRYERVSTLCHRCGVMGHVKRYCSISTNDMNLRAQSKVEDIRARLHQACFNAQDSHLLVKFHGTYDLHLIETAVQQG